MSDVALATEVQEIALLSEPWNIALEIDDLLGPVLVESAAPSTIFQTIYTAFPTGSSSGGLTLADIVYVHTQSVAAATWTVNHNLGRDVSVEVHENSGRTVIVEVQQTSPNQVVISSLTAFAGKAIVT